MLIGESWHTARLQVSTIQAQSRQYLRDFGHTIHYGENVCVLMLVDICKCIVDNRYRKDPDTRLQFTLADGEVAMGAKSIGNIYQNNYELVPARRIIPHLRTLDQWIRWITWYIVTLLSDTEHIDRRASTRGTHPWISLYIRSVIHEIWAIVSACRFTWAGEQTETGNFRR